MEGKYAHFRKTAFILCVLFAFVSAAIFSYQVYTFVSRPSPAAQMGQPSPSRPLPADDFLRGVSRDSPIVLIYSFFGMIISSLAAATMHARPEAAADEALPPAHPPIHLPADSRKLVDLLRENGGTLTQSELVKKSGMNKLRVSRIVKRLEKQKVLHKQPYGMTNSIHLVE